jgi:xanthine dehydrogenase accessory factor
MTIRVLARGGGDLASGAIIRMHRAGWAVLITELRQPKAVRRYASFAQAVYSGNMEIEGVTARRAESLDEARSLIAEGIIPVLVDPGAASLAGFAPQVLLDGRMLKRSPDLGLNAAPLVIGLGPGFFAGRNCHAVIETNRGPHLGRVIWQGEAQSDTGVPEKVSGYRAERVLRAPTDGKIEALVEIGKLLTEGQAVARIQGETVYAPFEGVLRGLMMDGLLVKRGEKIGDVDPRNDPQLCWLVSDKALAIGGAVLEAVLVWQAKGKDR